MNFLNNPESLKKGIKRLLNYKLNVLDRVISKKLKKLVIDTPLYGVTDGKAVGTYLEHKFQASLQKKYTYERAHPQKELILLNCMLTLKSQA